MHHHGYLTVLGISTQVTSSIWIISLSWPKCILPRSYPVHKEIYFFFFFFLMCVFCLYVTCVYVCACHPWNLEKGVRFPWISCWDSNLGPREEQTVIATTELCLQHLYFYFWQGSCLFFWNVVWRLSMCVQRVTIRSGWLTDLSLQKLVILGRNTVYPLLTVLRNPFVCYPP